MSLSSDSSAPVIECREVVKRYYYYTHRTSSLREWFIRIMKRRPINERSPEYTLSGFNISVGKGEAVALIGPNGAGKSTILRLIAGIYKPTEGVINVNGRMAAVIELGVGFHPELTGEENVALCGSILGMSPKELRQQYPEIVNFAGIGDFIQTPVKYYSTGMQARLAFAVSLNVHMDILLVDEVLAVGDKSFQSKCIRRLTSFQNAGGTLLVASHDLNMVLQLCQRAVWIDSGNIRMVGKATDVVKAYQGSVSAEESRSD